MLFQRINRSDPEKIFIVVSNGWSSAALSNGQCVAWDLGDATGVSVTKTASTTTAHNFAGIAVETIAPGAYGLIQVYGYHSSVIATCGTTGTNIYTGMPIWARTVAFNMVGPWHTSGVQEEVTLVTVGAPHAVAFEAYTMVATTTTIKAFIRAL